MTAPPKLNDIVTAPEIKSKILLQPPNIRTSAAAWLVSCGNSQKNQENDPT